MKESSSELENENILFMAEMFARQNSIQKLKHLLTIRGGGPDPNWDDEDKAVFPIVRRAIELALQ